MRLLRLLLAPFTFLLRLLTRPLKLWARRKAAGKDGWLELDLEGPVLDHYAPPPIPLIRRILQTREENPRVVLSQLSQLTSEIIADPAVRGVLVRIGGLSGGWSGAARLRRMLAAIRDSGKPVLVHLKHGAGNREYYVATAGTRILALPTAMVAPIGIAASTLFMRDALDRIGVRFEVASAGRYKSAPDALTRRDRSETDREQTTAIVSALDAAIVGAVAEGRKLSGEDAAALIDRAPLTGEPAVGAGFVDALAHDEELPGRAQALAALDHPPELVAAPEYHGARKISPLLPERRKRIGVVEVHGPITERGSVYLGYLEKLATEKAVVADLRAALHDRRVAAVILHVDSRGGSVAASDAIYAAVKRLAAEKPVIACFADVSASGGYYVACGAQAIVASPLTITGSIGVFGTFPTFPELAQRIGLNHDVIQQRRHASIFDPWRTRSEEERAHAQKEVESLYDAFITLVATARGKTKEEIDRVAQGRVWTGEEAMFGGLLDGLGGMDEALQRVRAAVKVPLADRPVIVRARRPMPRPEPPKPDKTTALLEPLLASGVPGEAALELVALLRTHPGARFWAYAPISVA